MKRGILTKILATILVLTMTLANIALLGTKSFALNSNLESQDTKTNNASVNFDAYFKDEGGNKIHTTTTDINSQTSIYLYVSVSEGYLKETSISINNPNFTLVSDGTNYDEIEKIDSSSNTIVLNKIRKGEQVELAIPIRTTKSEEISIDMFSKETEISINGLLVKDNSKTTKISKSIKVRAQWKGTAEINLEQGVIKYAKYQKAEEKGIVLQTKIKTSLINSNLPIEKTNIKTTIPTINGISPKKIEVTSDSTKATNGKDGSDFTTSNWNKDDKTINIEVNNTVKENKITWKKDNADEYILTFIYDEEAYTAVETSNAKIALETEATITAYNLETTKITKEDNKEGILTEQVNNIIMFNVETNKEINKGYMYTTNTTQYNENITIDIAKEDLAEKITVQAMPNTYIVETTEKAANTVYTETKINKSNFEKILGEDGYIKIYDGNSNLISTITKETETDEEGNIIIKYNPKMETIKIETSNPKTIGKIKIENTKEIVANNNKEEIKSYEILKTNIEGKVLIEEKELIKETKETQSVLIEPTTQVETQISNNTLSTTIENKNIEIRTILKSSDVTCKLFKNPTIKIQLPEYIDIVDFNEAVKILFTDELKIETGTYNPETKTLEIKLNGEQTIYNDVSIAQGPTIVLNTNIKLKQLTPSKTDEIVTTVINNGEEIQTKTQINYLAPVGMVTVNTITGYNGEAEVTSLSGSETTGKIETNTNAKTAEVKLTIINNNNNICKNIIILGRTPFEGNKGIVTGEDLGSTFTAALTSQILAQEGIDNNNVTVYYSTNENATKDLQEETNGWTTTPENLGAVKSYLIVLNNYEMPTGSLITFKYNAEIPEGLRNDEATFGTFIVYYDNVIAQEENTNNNLPNQEEDNTKNNQTNESNTIIQENTIISNNIIENNTTNNTIENTTNNNIQNNINSGNTTENTNNNTNEVLIPEQTESNTVGVATNVKPEVSVDITTNLEKESFVVEGQTVKYTATVVNMGKDTINNLTINIPVPEGTVHRQFVPGTSYSKDEIISTEETIITKQIPELAPNATERLEIEVMVKETDLKSIQAKAIVKSEGYEDVESKTITSYIIEGALNLELFTHKNSEETYIDGEEIVYYGYIENIRKNDKAKKVEVKCTIPDELEYVSAEYMETYDNDHNQVSYDESTKTATWNINSISGKARVMVVLKCKIKPGNTEVTAQMNATCSLSTTTAYSNKATRYIENAKLEAKQTSNIDKEYIDVGEILNYYIEVKNIGTKEATTVEVVDNLPNGVEKIYASYETKDLSKQDITFDENKVELSSFTIQPQETLKITIKATVSELASDAKGTIEFKNSATITADNIGEIKTNEIIHKLKVKSQQPDIPDEQKQYTISGKAWLDTSRDGIRDENEELLKNIEVMLITKEDAKTVKTTKTDKNGEYTFENIEKGEYIVVFIYDTTKYELTQYQVSGANEGNNSDAALQQEIKLKDGKTVKGAITNTIKVENANIYNIDIGLLESMKFDLALAKTITKVTRQNDDGIKTYDYSNGKSLAKIEIPSKQVNKTNIIIEYTIKVTNEGNIAGYAKQIVDYLPADLKFVSELNKDWYKSTDGNLYTKSLADTIIQPGETKEIKLIVTKATNANNLGTINNSAEIAESYNDYGVADVDSTPGNKITKEDDYGSADILISLNTGTIIMYTGLIISIISLIGVGVYMIKKKVLGNM